jgi:predicted amidophosphoribosyltransferase
MECPKCQFENPQDVKFCVHCGNKLETICAKCGSSNSLAFNFCGECGYDLRKSTEPLFREANEHKTQVSKPSLVRRKVSANMLPSFFLIYPDIRQCPKNWIRKKSKR